MITRLFKKVGIAIALAALCCLFAAATETATVNANGGLNFRTAPSSDAQIICTIPQGTAVSVVQKAGTWSKINYKSRDGYVMTQYLTFAASTSSQKTTQTATVAVSAANVRSAASKSSGIVTTLSRGTQVTILSFANNWYKIQYGSITGFIRGDLLTVNQAGVSRSGTTRDVASQKRANIVNYAATFLGTPYKSGGAGPGGFDCSGFTYYVFKQFGYTLPRGPASQMNALGTSVSKSNLLPGDLVFFKNPYSSSSGVGHVGIYVGNGQMIHSNSPGGSVRYVTINSGYYLTNYVGARRVIFD